MSDVEDVDLLVIGGGKAGKSLAMDRAKAGWNVVMVERDKIGGTCINVACIPTKALVGSARALATARRAPRDGCRGRRRAGDLAGEAAVSQGIRSPRDGLGPRDDVRRLGDGLRPGHRQVHLPAHRRDHDP
jgi:choline dehydrogenase-like flavoprotein